MKRIRQEHILFLYFVVSVVLTSVLCSRLFAAGIIQYLILYENLEQGWNTILDQGAGLSWKVAATRTATVSVIILCLRSRQRHRFVRLFSAGAGICTSVLISILTWSRGFSGFLFFLILWFPHGLCYGAAFFLLLLSAGEQSVLHKGKFWSALLCLLSLGMLAELKINPWFLHFIL